MKNRLFIKVVSIFLAVFITGMCNGLATAGADGLSLQDLEGNIINLSDYKGRIIILDFFATWCPPCKQEIPDFIELQDKYGGGRFTVIGISLSKMSDTKKFARDLGINYPVLIENGQGAGAYGPIRSVPTTLIIDQKSNVVKQYIGYKSKETFEADIKLLLK